MKSEARKKSGKRDRSGHIRVQFVSCRGRNLENHKMAVALEVLYALLLTVYHVIKRIVTIFIPQKMLEKDISGQVVLVTGGGSGIGRLMCLRFARLGATVVTWDINKLGNEDTVEMIKNEGYRAFSYTVDMSSK